MIKITDDPKELPEKGPLHIVNKAFHDGYHKQKKIIKQKVKSGDVLIITKLGNGIIASCGEERMEFVINDQYYHQLKAMAHLPIACYFALAQGKDREVFAAFNDWKEQNKSSDENSDKINRELELVLERFLQSNQENSTICHQSFVDLTKALEPIFARLLTKSADDEVAHLVDSLDKIREKFNKNSADIYLVVFGGHQPRYKEIAKLVFKQWFTELNENLVGTHHHVHYSESGETIEDAIDIVVNSLVDREIAQNFIGNANGLNQDVLGIVATDAINRFWKKHRHGCFQDKNEE